jgi:hypothetical protein
VSPFGTVLRNVPSGGRCRGVLATVVENVPASHSVRLYSTNWLTTRQLVVNVVFNQLVE